MSDEAKQITDLEEATSVANTDYLAVSQSGKTELTKASVATLRSAVAETLSEGALAELEYATSQGKNAIATALTNKGVATTASETLIQMADKVSNLSVDNSVEIPSTILQCSGEYTSWSTGYLAVQCNSKKYTAIANNGVLYIHKWTASTDLSDKTFAELTASDPSCTLDGITLNGYTRMVISGDGSKIAMLEPDTTNGQKVSMFSYNESANTVTLQGTYNMAGYTANATQAVTGISNDGTLIFTVAYSKTYTGESYANNFYLYDLTSNVDTQFTMEQRMEAQAGQANTKYGEVFSDGNYIYTIGFYSSYRTINKLAYTKNEEDNYVITQVGSIATSAVSAAMSDGRVTIFPNYKLIFLWGTSYVGGPFARFYSATDPNEKNQVAIIDLETMSIVRSDGLIVSATNVRPPAYTSDGSASNAGAQSYLIEQTDTNVFNIHLPTVGIVYTYNRTASSLTHADTPIGVIYQNGVHYGRTQNASYSGNYSYSSFALMNFYQNSDYVYLTYLGEYHAPNGDSETAFYTGTATCYIRLKYAKKQKSAYIQEPDFKYMLQPESIFVTNVADGYFNRETTITPVVPDEEDSGAGDASETVYQWTLTNADVATVYTKSIPTSSSTGVTAYTTADCTTQAVHQDLPISLYYMTVGSAPLTQHIYQWKTTPQTYGDTANRV